MSKLHKFSAIIIVVILTIGLSACETVPPADDGTDKPIVQKTDNWQYDPTAEEDDGYFGRGGSQKGVQMS